MQYASLLTRATSWYHLATVVMSDPTRLWLDPQAGLGKRRFYRAIIQP